MSAKYRWIVTKDYMRILIGNETIDRTGVEGPKNLDLSIIANPVNWVVYDDDHNPVYAGIMWGDWEGFEPLDDFGEGDAGCTGIKLNGGDYL